MGGGGGAPGTGGGGTTDAASDGPLATGLAPVATHGQLKVVGTQLQDQSGHPVQLKGVSSQWLNYESKTFPESKPAHPVRARQLEALGDPRGDGRRRARRLPGDRHRRQRHQAAMLSKVNTIVQNAIDLGIYVIIDWHTSDAVTATRTTQATQASAFFTMIATQYGATPTYLRIYNEPTVAYLGADQAVPRGGGGGDPGG